uniref:Uncharacterized protein n=1 Tax=viral metagenome TaxID=1070528 RepID=A0A6C0KD01_9ZZZZ
MYGTNGKQRMLATLDNRKFIQLNSMLYEAPPKTNEYQEETIEQKMQYSYGQPNEIMNDDASFRFKVPTKEIKEKFTSPTPSSGKEGSGASSSSDSSDSNSSCGISDDGSNICGGTNLFPILDPRFNLREAAKNMILLEDHLFHYGKRCHDCILKHCLTVEGFLEEGITLDKKREYSDILNSSLDQFRKIQEMLYEKIKTKNLTDEECCGIAQSIRVIRKPLCQKYATFLK